MPSQTLSLTQSQQLQMVLAPQLRQSLEMLQVPILELRAMVQQEIEQNPTLEELPNANTENVEIEGEVSAPDDKKELDFEKEFEVLARLDDEWRDYFYQNLQTNPHRSDAQEKRDFLLNSVPQRESLQEHLLNQLNFAELPEADRQIGELIIGSINDDGYLMGDIESLAGSVGTDVHHLEDVLLVVQDFHPTGVGARDLRECLLLQLERLGQSTSLANDIVAHHLTKLGTRKIPEIAKALKVSIDDVQNAAKVIATLDPKPGHVYSADTAHYVEPEIVVQKIDGEWVIMLNDDHLPHLRISNTYRRLMSDPDTKSDVKSYIRERIRSGTFLMKSIQQRQSTIHRIATEIVSRQEAFLDHGVSRLRPLTMAEVASVVGVHETTVSRAVANKYMRTPEGVLELKYFFTPGIKTTDGTEVSNKTVKDMISSLVTDEDPAKPLSDQEIMEALKEEGIKIARRTIAKYRLVLRIPPSHMRKIY